MTATPPSDTECKPTLKQQRFIEAYLQCWNGAEAARQAGYKNSKLAAVRLLRRPEIRTAIDKRMDELAMSAREVLTRLSDQGRVNVDDFLEKKVVTRYTKWGFPISVEVVDINWDELKRRGHLVKKVGWDKNGNPVIELYDAQAALVQLGRHRKLFNDQLDVNFLNSLKAYIGVNPDDWDEPDPQHSVP